MQDIPQLHPLEVQVLRNFPSEGAVSLDSIRENVHFSTGQINQAISRLLDRVYIEKTHTDTHRWYERTELGASLAELGSVDSQIISCIHKNAVSVTEIASFLELTASETGPALGRLVAFGAISIGKDKKLLLKDKKKADIVCSIDVFLAQDSPINDKDCSEEQRAFMQLVSKKRGASATLFRVGESEHIAYSLTTEGCEIQKVYLSASNSEEALGSLTPAMLKDGSWRGKEFRPYDVQQPPVRVLLGKRNVYADYLQEVKDQFVALGFQEFDGPLVETDFWNTDALFMPQFHSARDIHDVYAVKNPQHATEVKEPYFSNVKKTHEHGWNTGSRGWRYAFNEQVAKRLVLRSQGTVLSAKTLPNAQIPGKYFGIVRCFRHDQVDATHLSDFYQVEGIVLGEDVNLQSLLGYLKMFAEEIAGAREVRYVPAYFPFVEPGVEIHIKHPQLGWFELGGSGIFRQEVTHPLGVTVPVLAWGLGIDRMALMRLGLKDLRDLFSYDLDVVRLRR